MKHAQYQHCNKHNYVSERSLQVTDSEHAHYEELRRFGYLFTTEEERSITQVAIFHPRNTDFPKYSAFCEYSDIDAHLLQGIKVLFEQYAYA